MKIRLLFVAISLLALTGCEPTDDLPVFTSNKWDGVSARLDTGISVPIGSMELVQKFVNKVPYMSDENNYGVAGYWAPPREFFRRQKGDCEDYAIAKYALGLENNLFRPEEAKLVNALDLARDNQAHMLLVVRGKVYDNQFDDPFDLQSLEAQRYKMLGVVQTAAR